MAGVEHREHRRCVETLLRIDYVLNRGVDRSDIVRDDEDRHEWFRLFNRVAKRRG